MQNSIYLKLDLDKFRFIQQLTCSAEGVAQVSQNTLNTHKIGMFLICAYSLSHSSFIHVQKPNFKCPLFVWSLFPLISHKDFFQG